MAKTKSGNVPQNSTGKAAASKTELATQMNPEVIDLTGDFEPQTSAEVIDLTMQVLPPPPPPFWHFKKGDIRRIYRGNDELFPKTCKIIELLPEKMRKGVPMYRVKICEGVVWEYRVNELCYFAEVSHLEFYNFKQ